MANNKSAKKRIKLNKRNNLQNKYYKTSFRNLLKNFLQKLDIYQQSQKSEEKQELTIMLKSIYSILDKGTKRNVFSKNMAARHKSNLHLSLKNAILK